MIFPRFSPAVTALQYSLLTLFTLQAVLVTAPFTTRWWWTIVLVLIIGLQFRVWPVRKAYVYPYLIVMGALITGLTLLSQEFMYLVFNFSVTAVLLLKPRSAFLMTGAVCLVLDGILGARYGLNEVIYPGLILISGSFAFGYAYHMGEQADHEREKTQKLLDELRDAHTRLEEYAGQAQELAAIEERNRLARELHDSVKQQAFAASGQLGAGRALLREDPAAAQDHLLKAEALMDEIRRELGQLIYALRPMPMQGKGLAEALREWGDGWSQQSGIALQLTVRGERELAAETDKALLRIAQEALYNVARHSRARNAVVALEFDQGMVCLSIRDDGQGFDPAAASSGIGLHSMRERAERLAEGSFKVESTAGAGTCISVRCSG